MFILFICIKRDLALNNPQWLMSHKTKQIQKDTTVWSTESSTDGSDPLIKEVPWIRH